MFYDSLSKRWAMCLASESILMAEAIMDWQWTLLYPIGSFLDMEKRWRKLSLVQTCVVDRCLYLFLHLFSHYHIGPKSQNTLLIIWKKGFQCKGNKGLTVAHPLQRSTPWTFQTTGTHGQTNGDDKPLKSRSNLKPWPRRGFQNGNSYPRSFSSRSWWSNQGTAPQSQWWRIISIRWRKERSSRRSEKPNHEGIN